MLWEHSTGVWEEHQLHQAQVFLRQCTKLPQELWFSNQATDAEPNLPASMLCLHSMLPHITPQNRTNGTAPIQNYYSTGYFHTTPQNSTKHTGRLNSSSWTDGSLGIYQLKGHLSPYKLQQDLTRLGGTALNKNIKGRENICWKNPLTSKKFKPSYLNELNNWDF